MTHRLRCALHGGIVLILLSASSGCATRVLDKKAGIDTGKPAANQDSPVAEKAVDLAGLPVLTREDFNRMAASFDLPLFWSGDKQNPGVLDPEELVLLGIDTSRDRYVKEGAFTPEFNRWIRAMVERRRREAVARELDYCRPTLVQSDFSGGSPADKAIVRHVTRAARIIEELFALQLGSFELQNCLVPGDGASRALFRRNQRPWCQAPRTQKDPFCNACPEFPQPAPGLYPAPLNTDPELCAKLNKDPDAKKLLDPFVVVRNAGERLVAVPYHKEWPQRMAAVAGELRAAAKALPEGEEQAFKTYLLAAAKGFETNQWEEVDEAWAAMNAKNSMWYLRIAPDEVYEDPCSRKAMFHVSFARIDPDSLYWQGRLAPLREEMERSLANLIGKSYAPRPVQFHMPDFIEIILNAGDARDPSGATVGQSLPNWGKVAVEGRGRTVVMSNLYTDADSQIISRARGDALLDAKSMQMYTEEKRLALLDIILHEATHNFGPHSDFQIEGKRPSDIFGGVTATILEELKAQTGALFYADFLRTKGLLSDEDAAKVYNHAIRWCFGHISRGMTNREGRPMPYSQVAAIHIATLVDAGALVWGPDKTAANGTDQGCFTVHYDKVPAAMRDLMGRVGRIKAEGLTADAAKLIDSCVKGEGYQRVHAAEITERVLRHPKASFVYSVTY